LECPISAPAFGHIICDFLFLGFLGPFGLRKFFWGGGIEGERNREDKNYGENNFFPLLCVPEKRDGKNRMETMHAQLSGGDSVGAIRDWVLRSLGYVISQSGERNL